MRSDIHSKALRAAAKVAFSVAFLGGCSAAAQDPETPSNDSDTDEAELKSGCHLPKTPATDASAPKLSCDQVVAAAFPTEGDYPGVKQSVAADVQSCCVELLEKSHGALASHRWDCCANLSASVDQSVSIACTPWGPPVPPSMKSRRTLQVA
jgi:hypothetical protein